MQPEPGIRLAKPGITCDEPGIIRETVRASLSSDDGRAPGEKQKQTHLAARRNEMRHNSNRRRRSYRQSWTVARRGGHATAKQGASVPVSGSRRGTILGPNVAAFHSMTSSARPRIACGISMPIERATLRLIASSNFVGCWAGVSPGGAPFSILSVRAATMAQPSDNLVP
jgi:hypothetical protein